MPVGRPHGIYETVLYAADVAEAAEFYAGVLGFRRVSFHDELGAAFRLDDGSMLLLFDPELADRPGRAVPSHGADGPGHVAFSVRRGSIEGWRKRLAEQGLEIERELSWDAGGRSIYVRDPAGNSVELVDGEAWQ